MAKLRKTAVEWTNPLDDDVHIIYVVPDDESIDSKRVEIR
jgi:hypothetical protein